MFQQKHIEEYQNITAPTELKDRVRFSVDKTRRTMRKRVMMFTAVAAGVAIFLVSGSLLGNRSTILSVNDVVVTREALLIDNQDAVLLSSNMGQKRCLPIHIPMKIEVDGNAKIKVNVGTLMQMLDENQYSAETTHIKLSENANLYWMLEEDSIEIPTLTITSGRTVEQYVVEYQVDTECYSIRKAN